ncbi:hypothetical protein PanWU01x14_041880 [Parasponia andersonii]|uniref:RNase H type-1 domain-containing protein n=1 Tax=Parasponia andersonii TaxID=3476 RepID=A0A2P5DQI9_PARAD|nr:hypothetical protein PanWU01x14_041880 [Parasponia andersonii]
MLIEGEVGVGGHLLDSYWSSSSSAIIVKLRVLLSICFDLVKTRRSHRQLQRQKQRIAPTDSYRTPTGSPIVKCERPGPGKLKLNVDAACFGNIGFIKVGGIIRDCNGLVKAASVESC